MWSSASVAHRLWSSAPVVHRRLISRPGAPATSSLVSKSDPNPRLRRHPRHWVAYCDRTQGLLEHRPNSVAFCDRTGRLRTQPWVWVAFAFGRGWEPYAQVPSSCGVSPQKQQQSVPGTSGCSGAGETPPQSHTPSSAGQTAFGGQSSLGGRQNGSRHSSEATARWSSSSIPISGPACSAL